MTQHLYKIIDFLRYKSINRKFSVTVLPYQYKIVNNDSAFVDFLKSNETAWYINTISLAKLINVTHI